MTKFKLFFVFTLKFNFFANKISVFRTNDLPVPKSPSTILCSYTSKTTQRNTDISEFFPTQNKNTRTKPEQIHHILHIIPTKSTHLIIFQSPSEKHLSCPVLVLAGSCSKCFSENNES